MPDIISTVGNGHASPDYATLALYNAGDGGLDPGVGFTAIAECSGYLGAAANINGTFIRGATIRGDIVFDGKNDSSLANTDRLTISAGSGVNVEDLRIFTNNQYISALNYNADFIVMDRVVLDNTTAGVNAIDINGDFTNGYIRNFVARGGADAVMAGFNQGTNLTNGLIYGAADKGIEGSSSAPMVLTNILAFNNGGQDIDSAGGFTLIDVATEDATGTYTGYTSAELVDFASGDLRTKSTSDLSTFGTPFIGAFLKSGGGGEILAIDSSSNLNTLSESSLTTQSTVFAVDSLASTQALSESTLTQSHTIPIDNIINLQSLSQPTFTQASVLSVNSLSNGQTLSDVALSVAGALSVNPISNDNNVSNVTFTSSGALSVNNLDNNQPLSAAEFVQGYLLSTKNISNTHSISLPDINAGTNFIVQDISSAQNITASGVTQHNIILVDPITNTQLIGVVNIGDDGQNIGKITAAFKESGISVKYGTINITVKFKE